MPSISGSGPERVNSCAVRAAASSTWSSTCVRGSPTLRRWLSFELDGDLQNSIFIPPGCAHGFQALTPVADTTYRIDRRHDPAEDVTIAWNDPELSIPWPLPVSEMSERDAAAPPLSALAHELTAMSPPPV